MISIQSQTWGRKDGELEKRRISYLNNKATDIFLPWGSPTPPCLHYLPTPEILIIFVQPIGLRHNQQWLYFFPLPAKIIHISLSVPPQEILPTNRLVDNEPRHNRRSIGHKPDPTEIVLIKMPKAQNFNYFSSCEFGTKPKPIDGTWKACTRATARKWEHDKTLNSNTNHDPYHTCTMQDVVEDETCSKLSGATWRIQLS